MVRSQDGIDGPPWSTFREILVPLKTYGQYNRDLITSQHRSALFWDSHLRNGTSWYWQWECIHCLIVSVKASTISLLMNSGKFIAYSSTKKLLMCAKFTQHGGSRSFATYWRPWNWCPLSKTSSFTGELPLAVHAEKTKLTLLGFVLQIYWRSLNSLLPGILGMIWYDEFMMSIIVSDSPLWFLLADFQASRWWYAVCLAILTAWCKLHLRPAGNKQLNSR